MNMSDSQVPQIGAVYKAITKVQSGVAKQGIAKNRKNQQQGYSFRGIDDVYNALAPLLSDAGLCILPNVLSREVVERTTQKGGVLFYVTVKIDFAFVSADDGSAHHVVVYGEAMDSADKATNKAMSAAYKYACMQAFCIPTEGDNDADQTTHEVSAFITPSQVADLKALAQEVGADLPKFLEWLGFAKVEEITTDMYSRAVKGLEKKRAPVTPHA